MSTLMPALMMRLVARLYNTDNKTTSTTTALDCVTQCSQSTAHLREQFSQVKQIGFITLGPLRCA